MTVRIHLQVSGSSPELMEELARYPSGRARANRLKGLAEFGLRVERGLVAPSSLPATPPVPPSPAVLSPSTAPFSRAPRAVPITARATSVEREPPHEAPPGDPADPESADQSATDAIMGNLLGLG